MSESLELHGERVLLRPITRNDMPAYEKHFIDYEVIRHLSDRIPWLYPEHGVKDWVDNHILALQGNNRRNWGIFSCNRVHEIIDDTP